MHTVAILHSFVRAAASAGMSDAEVDELVDYLAEHPTAGVEMRESGGCRKLRWAGRGKGKSGGYRTITFYTGETMPVFLITLFSKGEKANLSVAERKRLGVTTKAIVDAYQSKVASMAKKGA